MKRLLALMLCAVSLGVWGQCSEGEIAVDFVITPGSYPSEITWQLNDADGNNVFFGGGAVIPGWSGSTGVWCLAPGYYTFIGSDSYGDGWNFATASFSVNGTLIANFDFDNDECGGPGCSKAITLGVGVGSGCTDPQACNYSGLATEDDGSCTVLDECGICGGEGIAEGDCDCDGNQVDAVGVCGGGCLADYDGNGVCDALEAYGCTYEGANNFDPQATSDDGSCVFPCVGEVNANVFDWDGDYSVTVTDFLMMLTVFGDVDVDFDGVWDSADECIDTEACNYDADPSEPCQYIDVLGICGGGCPEDADADGVCDDVDDCIGVIDECGVCNGPGATEVVIEDITILYDSVYAENIDTWFVYELSADTTFSFTCGSSDVESPTVCTPVDVEFSIIMDALLMEAGDQLNVQDTFCDNLGLFKVQWTVDNIGASIQPGWGLLLQSGTNWSVTQTTFLIPEEDATYDLLADVPLTSRGIWNVEASVVDVSGNTATFNTDLHVENSYMPEFTLTSVSGEDPANWGDWVVSSRPTWAAGTDVFVEGSVTDSDGIAYAELSLIHEATETVVWSAALTEFDAFSETVMVPAGASGEFYFRMRAGDHSGVFMETGFPVGVE